MSFSFGPFSTQLKVHCALLVAALIMGASATAQQTLIYLGPPLKGDEKTAGPRHAELSRLRIEVSLPVALTPKRAYRFTSNAFDGMRVGGDIVNEIRWTDGISAGRAVRTGHAACSPKCPDYDISIWTDAQSRPWKWTLIMREGSAKFTTWAPAETGCPARDAVGATYKYKSAPNQPESTFSYAVNVCGPGEWSAIPAFPPRDGEASRTEIARAYQPTKGPSQQTLTYVGPKFEANEKNAGGLFAQFTQLKIVMKLRSPMAGNAQYRFNVTNDKSAKFLQELRWSTGFKEHDGQITDKGCEPIYLGCPDYEVFLSTDAEGRPAKWNILIPANARITSIAEGESRCAATDKISGSYAYMRKFTAEEIRSGRRYFGREPEERTVDRFDLKACGTGQWSSDPPFSASVFGAKSEIAGPEDERARLLAVLEPTKTVPPGRLDEPAGVKQGRLLAIERTRGESISLRLGLNLARSAERPSNALLARSERASSYLGHFLQYPKFIALSDDEGVTPFSFWNGFNDAYMKVSLSAKQLPMIINRLSPIEQEFVSTLVDNQQRVFADVNAAIAGDSQAIARLASIDRAIETRWRLKSLADAIGTIDSYIPLLQTFFSRVERPKALEKFKFAWDYEAAKSFMQMDDMKAAEAAAVKWMRLKDTEWPSAMRAAQKDRQIDLQIQQKYAEQLQRSLDEISRSFQGQDSTCYDRQEFVLGPGDKPDGQSIFGLPYVIKQACR